ncbi:MAG: UDP-3-O-(3-hydroxymyristoyl)glucosamine N-acyltransferase [Nitrospira sp.]|nr:UDP-3-O-(3-hydroxymyristoyl)glucosamine N-acyltransferase [Nitrospira sp.]
MAVPIVSKPTPLSEIHQAIGGTLHGDGTVELSVLASLNEATAHALSFVLNDKALKGSPEIRAGALLTHRPIPELRIPQIVVPNPLLALAQVAQRFFVRPYTARGIATEVIRGKDVRIGTDPSIWPFVTLGDGVTLGARVTLYPGVFIGAGSTIGDGSLIYPNVVIREGCTIGKRVIIHSGTVIGSDGFGYVQHEGRHHKIPQLGGVTIEDDVELGANVSIDRATLGQTLIRKGTKVDNLVQIAHNVTIGEHAILVAQVGIAGSSTIGRHVMIGGQAGLADHIQIGDQVMIAARAGVNRNLESNQIVSGSPVMPHETWMKAQAVIPRLPELRRLLHGLEARVALLEEQAAKTGRARIKAKSSRKTTARTTR